MLPYGRKNPLPYPLFRSGHMSAICARLSKGKVGVQRGRKTAGCPSFLPLAVGTASSPPAVGTASSPAAGAATFPPSADGESPPRRAPQSPALRRAQLPAEVQQKNCRPLGANTLTQFVCPGQPVQKMEPPR